MDDMCAVGPDIYLTNSSCEIEENHYEGKTPSQINREGLFSSPIFERSFQWKRRESKYRLDQTTTVFSSARSNNNSNDVASGSSTTMTAKSLRHSSSLTWRNSGDYGGVGLGSFRLAPSSSFFSKLQPPLRQLHHHNSHHPHEHNTLSKDDSDEFPIETGFSVCPDNSSNQPTPRNKLKRAFSSSSLFKSRNFSSSYNLKKKNSTHENIQEISNLRLLTTERKEAVFSAGESIQGDILNDDHCRIGVLHAKVIFYWYTYI